MCILRFLLLVVLSLFGALSSVSGFGFITPPEECSPPLDNETFDGNGVANITWSTEDPNYTIYLGYVTGDLDFIKIYQKTVDQPEEGRFLWNLSSSKLPNIDAVSYLVCTMGAMSRPFQITNLDVILPPNSSSTATVSSSIPTLSTSTLSATEQATSSITLTTPSAFSTTPNPSPNKTKVYIGISVGVGISLIIVSWLCIKSRYACCKRSKNSKIEHVNSQSLDTESPITSYPDLRLETNTECKPELPTQFNIARSMRPLFLSKFELPGYGEKLQNVDGPFEVAAD